MSVDYREFQSASHLDERRLLYADCFREEHVAGGASEDHYLWKFRGLGGETAAYEYAAFEQSKLIGYYAALPYRYKIGGKAVVCGMVCDVMTHSSCRGRGIFTGLGRHSLRQLRESGVGFVSGYPIRPEVLPGHLKVGWAVAFRLPLYAKVLRVNSVFQSKGVRFLSPLGNALARAHLLASRLASPAARDYEIEALDKEEFLDLTDYDAFLADWGGSLTNHLEKDRDFLRWRLGAPGAHYRVLTMRRGKRLVGVSILRKTRFQGIPVLAILDLMVLPSEKRGLGALHRQLELEAKRQGVEVLGTMMSPTTAKRYRLASSGFLRTPFGFKLILNRLDETLDMGLLTREENWDLTWIDSDDM